MTKGKEKNQNYIQYVKILEFIGYVNCDQKSKKKNYTLLL